MWPTRAKRLAIIEQELSQFSQTKRKMPGIRSSAARHTLAMQMIASIRRLEYTEILKNRPIDPRRANPNDPLFDPERAALIHARAGDFDEAVWIVFLSVHFGKHPRHGWQRMRDVYSGLGRAWTWTRVVRNVQGFRDWLSANEDNIGGAFGNHRKYESLDAYSRRGTGEVVASYVNWIGPARSHRAKFNALIQAGGNDPHAIFDKFYQSMKVSKFGRLGKFDFLALLGRLDLAPISPGFAYLAGASGPLSGTRLLFDAAMASVADLEVWLRELDGVLNVGMQVMEDSICNWQKSPSRFVHFRG